MEGIALDGRKIMSASVRFGSGKNLPLCAIDGGETIVVVSQNKPHRDQLVNESITEALRCIKSLTAARGKTAGQGK